MPPESLLSRARKVKVNHQRNVSLPTKDELALCLAYVNGELSLRQVSEVLGKTTPQAHSWMRVKIFCALRNGGAVLVVKS